MGLLREVTLKKISYVDSKHTIHEIEVYRLIKEFFREYLNLDYQFTFQELKNELSKVYLDKTISEQIHKLIDDFSVFEYKDEKLSQEKLHNLLKRFEDVVSNMLKKKTKLSFLDKIKSLTKKSSKEQDPRELQQKMMQEAESLAQHTQEIAKDMPDTPTPSDNPVQEETTSTQPPKHKSPLVKEEISANVAPQIDDDMMSTSNKDEQKKKEETNKTPKSDSSGQAPSWIEDEQSPSTPTEKNDQTTSQKEEPKPEEKSKEPFEVPQLNNQIQEEVPEEEPAPSVPTPQEADHIADAPVVPTPQEMTSSPKVVETVKENMSPFSDDELEEHKELHKKESQTKAQSGNSWLDDETGVEEETVPSQEKVVAVEEEKEQFPFEESINQSQEEVPKPEEFDTEEIPVPQPEEKPIEETHQEVPLPDQSFLEEETSQPQTKEEFTVEEQEPTPVVPSPQEKEVFSEKELVQQVPVPHIKEEVQVQEAPSKKKTEVKTPHKVHHHTTHQQPKKVAHHTHHHKPTHQKNDFDKVAIKDLKELATQLDEIIADDHLEKEYHEENMISSVVDSMQELITTAQRLLYEKQVVKAKNVYDEIIGRYNQLPENDKHQYYQPIHILYSEIAAAQN